MKSIKVAWLILLLASAAGVARAQGVGASGDIKGTVTDPSGAVLPNAAVTATEAEKGLQHKTHTDPSGQYLFPGLMPGAYDLTVELSGFQTQIHKGVIVDVGQTTTIDFRLKVSATATSVVVTGEPPLIDTERGRQANTIGQTLIEDLPINRRDYLSFTLLLPGVSNSTRLADDQDFRVKQTPQSGLSFYGSNGRGNSVTVDGGEANDDAGGVRLTASQDAVREFQVNRSNYSADLGGASGASINIVTKSGTNEVHGGAFGFFRNDVMDARDPFAVSQALQPKQVFDPNLPDSVSTPIKNSLSRYQYGANVGLPVQKDTTFLFGSFEGLLQNAQNAVPLLTDTSIFRPTAAQNTIFGALAAQGSTPVPCFNNPNGTITTLPSNFCAGALKSALTVSQSTGLSMGQMMLNQFLVSQFEANGGLFNYNTREYLASVRLDHHHSDANQFSLIYRFGHDLEENPDVQSLTGFSAGSSIHNYDDDILGAWYHQFSPRTQNELRLQFDYNSFNVIPNEPGEVGLQIAGFANNLGTNIFLPNLTITRRTEIADNVSIIRGRHRMRFGGTELLRGNHTESHTFLPGRFVFGNLPGFALSQCLSNPTGSPSNPQNPGCGLPASVMPTFINSLQAASLGAPQVYQQGFGNADYPAYTRPFTALYWQDSWTVTSNFTLNYGLRYEIDSQYNPLSTYYKDFAPRVSFAWDPFKDHKTVVRGGYGIFYSPVYSQISQVDLSLGVLNKNYSTVENKSNTSQVPDQVNNLVNTCGIGFPGFPIFPGNNTSPCTRFIGIYVDPLSSTGLPIQNSAVVFQTLFAQGKIQCTQPAPGNAACITPADVAPLGIIATNTKQLSPLTVVFSNPPNYRPPYAQQASLGVEREIVPGLSVSASFIYVHTLRLPVALDTNLFKAPMSTITLANGKTVSYRNWNTRAVTDPAAGLETSGPGSGGVYPCAITLNGFGQPVSPCFVNVLVTQNNQYTDAASALYEGGIFEVRKRFSNHFTLLGNYTYSKAYDTSTDFNSDFGPQDPTNLSLDRALSAFDERHKVVIAGVIESPWRGSILSGFELAPIFSYNSGHPFNLLAGGEVNGDNHTTNERPIGAPRNTGIGPSYTDFDMRLGWQHKLGEKVSMQLTAEGFNIANHTNYASVNNEVGPLFGILPGFTTFNVHGSRNLSPSTPLGFTSAFPKRQIQLGVRFAF
jgi:hypothetical protein